MTRRCTSLKGKNVLFEYACSDDSVIGRVAEQTGVQCIRLGKSTLDLCNPDHVSQAIEQAEAIPGSDAWISIDCTHYSPIQNLNIHIHGKSYQRKLETRRAQTKVMLAYAMQFAINIMQNYGRIVFELPKDSGIWKLDEWKQFASAYNLKWVVFDGCALGLKSSSGAPLRKPWCLYTNDIRIINFFSQFVCPGDHVHDETMGKNAKMSAFYTEKLAHVLIECWYPQHWYKNIPALVTLNLPKSQWVNDPRGLEAVRKEGEGLRKNGTWDDTTVQLVADLKSNARKKGIQIKLAELLTLCGIKHYELEPEHWKWKGRICYRGDIVRDAWNNILMFEETATTPTSLVALNVALWFASFPNHSASCADAVQAFLQSALDDDEETWVVLPQELWLSQWHDRFSKTDRICVKLKRSLYGHPKAGRWWQDHLHQRLQELGAGEIPQYPSNYLIPWEHDGKAYTLLLNVYVDDLTLCGPSCCHKSFWSKLRQTVKLEDEEVIDGKKGSLILGRRHFIQRQINGSTCLFDMKSYADGVVETYCQITGFDRSRLKKVPTPFLPESYTDEDLSQAGDLQKDASRILMRMLWLSRLSRPDLSFIVTRLASRVASWTKFEDRQLHRCISYVNCTKDFILKGKVDQQSDPILEVFTDADFASCQHSAKSTSGLWIQIRTGNGAVFPIFWQAKKQGSVARSTTESEIISMATGMFGEVLNLQTFLEYLMQKPIELLFHQDNDAVLKILKNKYSAKLRHMNRVHKVNVASLCEVLEQEGITAIYCPTADQRANGFTKIIPPHEWKATTTQMCLDEVAADVQQ